MAKQAQPQQPVPYPKNWSTMTRAQKQKWEEDNRGRAPRPVSEPVRPAATTRAAPTAAPTVPPMEADEADEYEEPTPTEPAGRLVHNAQTADEVRDMGEAAGELADKFDKMTGREIVAAILRGLSAGCDPNTH